MSLSLSLSMNWCSDANNPCFTERGQDALLACNSVTDIAVVVTTLVLAILGLKGSLALSPAVCYAFLGISAGVTIIDLTCLLVNSQMLKCSGKAVADN